MFDYSDLRRIIVEALIILALSVVIGLSLNLPLIRDLVEGRAISVSQTTAPAQSSASFPEPVDLETVKQLRQQQTPLLDARIGELYRQGHIAGAISFPLDEADQNLAQLQRRFPPDQTLISYCNGYGCPDSFDLALKLIAAGYERVLVFEGGFPQWRDAGLAVETEE